MNPDVARGQERHRDKPASCADHAGKSTDNQAEDEEAERARQVARRLGLAVAQQSGRGECRENSENQRQQRRRHAGDDERDAHRTDEDAGREPPEHRPQHGFMHIVRAHAGNRREHDRPHRRGNGNMQNVFRREMLIAENQCEQRDHGHSAADAEQAGDETHDAADRDEDRNQRPVHARPRSAVR